MDMLSLGTALFYGASVTVVVSLSAIFAGTSLGLVLALIRTSRVPVFSGVVAVYVSISRATPLVTLALLIFFGLPALGVRISPLAAGILALTLSTSGFQAEIWRGAISSVPKGAIDAAKSIGMPTGLQFQRIVLPIAYRAALPGIVNEMTLLIKASPAIAVVGAVDLTRAAIRVSSVTYDPLPPFLGATVIYILIVMSLIRVQRLIERSNAKRFSTL